MRSAKGKAKAPVKRARSASRPSAILRGNGEHGPAEGSEVYDRIWNAIMDHSLPPETRLVEERLCEIFGVGRTRLRQVLQRLAHERVVTLTPNRGAIVSRPSIREAREVFAARTIIEAGVVSTFIELDARADMRRIVEHVAREKTAWRQNDRRSMLKLSGDFHLVIAEVAGNHILLELLRDLISRSSLIIAVYRTPGSAPCPPDEHQELAAALERRDRSAVTLMTRHLENVLADLRLEERAPHELDLRTVFSGKREQSP
jgi:DNA-binding GntR family transcriptional regulator